MIRNTLARRTMGAYSTPDDTIFNNGNYENFAEIMYSTNALWRNNDESETKPKENKSWKWKHILKPIWDENYLYTGDCLTPSVPAIIYHVNLLHS